eukprot:TRINITY_DN53809_c0_g1_i1.p2 TRINITY_DN53809_c0_g1~~TRINITY_DN53809_c0_g1_i1.p2  ORF type:complete len:184 (+),score=101.84 TRINITY_DN53809_c0_g1_i1:3-554(+)
MNLRALNTQERIRAEVVHKMKLRHASRSSSMAYWTRQVAEMDDEHISMLLDHPRFTLDVDVDEVDGDKSTSANRPHGSRVSSSSDAGSDDGLTPAARRRYRAILAQQQKLLEQQEEDERIQAEMEEARDDVRRSTQARPLSPLAETKNDNDDDEADADADADAEADVSADSISVPSYTFSDDD